MKNILISFLKNQNKCSHRNALLNSEEGYCPDCGKYLKKYYGVIPVLCYTIRTEGEENRLKGFCDNFVFDDYVPLAYRKEQTKTED